MWKISDDCLENSLRNFVETRLTICGVFIRYRRYTPIIKWKDRHERVINILWKILNIRDHWKINYVRKYRWKRRLANDTRAEPFSLSPDSLLFDLRMASITIIMKLGRDSESIAYRTFHNRARQRRVLHRPIRRIVSFRSRRKQISLRARSPPYVKSSRSEVSSDTSAKEIFSHAGRNWFVLAKVKSAKQLRDVKRT